jgi:dihydrofolate reductase
MKNLALISAVARNGVIGIENRLPWQLPEDLAFFKKTTMGHAILMGRNTYDSIGRPLPGRCNIVLTREQNWQPNNLLSNIPIYHENALESLKTYAETEVIVCQSLTSLKKLNLSLSLNSKSIFVIGGAQIYEATLPFAKRLLLTEIHADFEGDVYFPKWNRAAFREISRETHPANQKRKWGFDFVSYERL